MSQRVVIVILLAVLPSCSFFLASDEPVGDDPARYPFRCAGVFVGISNDASVRALYGGGLFVEEESHGGGRYWTDKVHSNTLHVGIGVDEVIEEVSLSRGVDIPRRSDPLPASLVSDGLDGNEAMEGGIRLGASPVEIIRAFGKPTKDTAQDSERTITYESDYEKMKYVLAYSATFAFQQGKLVKVTLYQGE